MVHPARRRVVAHVPESALRTLTSLRHGELAWQRGVASLRRATMAAPPDGYLDLPRGAGLVRARVVDAFDAHEVRRANSQLVCGALDAAGVPYVLLPGARDNPYRVVVSLDDRPAAVAGLDLALTGPEWRMDQVPVPMGSLSTPGRGADLTIYRHLAAPNGQLLAGAELACPLDFWERIRRSDVPRPDGGFHLPDTRVSRRRNATVAYLSPHAWQVAVAAPSHWPTQPARRSAFAVAEPVDIVYTWVDGEDPAWLERKAAYSAGAALAELNVTATHDSRYVSHDELRYSLRSVGMYASWVRRIFIVTDDQVPAWLDVSHPQIEMVSHRQIFRDPSALPVFNSHAIESQLHHIDGLAEQYLYLNDDVFFNRLVEPELFFHGNGMARFFLSPNTLDLDPASSHDLPIQSAAKHNRAVIEADFGVTITHKFKHTPQPQLKSVVDEIEQRHPELVDQVSRSRFRHPDDVSIPSALHHYYAYCLGRALPGPIGYRYQDLGRPEARRRLAALLRPDAVDVFCLNEVDGSPDTVELRRAVLLNFLQRKFPLASPFELADSGL